MSKGKRSLRPLGAWDDYPHLQRLLDDGEQFVNVDLTDLGQKLKAETAPDHRCSRQRTLFGLVQPLQTSADDQPDVFRNVDLVDLDVFAELTRRIEDFPLFDQMPVYFFDEECISLAFLKDGAQHTLRNPALAQAI